eukprot:TRINITY_DN2774_c1_g4_i1.p1 TRINITY_DN2774_c1_g4~~TRINITY_DN2774_c1_g4_i1.p1  ORF type:complete len:2307 (+),score=559.49 TRINITY_DN2774_c1_g4_i1:84-7004(+)
MGGILPKEVVILPGRPRPRGCSELGGAEVVILPGRPRPRGCSELGGAVNFALQAPGSNSAWLLVQLPEGHPGLSAVGVPAGADAGAREAFVQLDATQDRSGDTWHVALQAPFTAKGTKYAWLLDPPLDSSGLPVASARRILDPCAHCLDSPCASAWNQRNSQKYSPLAVVPDPRVFADFNWQGVKPPGLHMKDLVIYEAHVRGFTKNKDSGLSDWDVLSGSYLGFVEKIPHLLRLGVNCVELLPVFEFDETACPRKNPRTGEQLCNYWGYSTVSFAAPMQRFSSRSEPGGAIVGFKTLVRELHRQGIEVILDVVFNHTAEGTWGELNWHSLASISKSTYYILSKGKDTNYTGCGNTVNANDKNCADWICECLRFWVEEMHVDGFRFDLASALCRGPDGKVQREPELIRRIVCDPVLSRAKLIAEPWDCSWPDGYLVGRFPSCGPPRFAEWNGKFRDTVRCFLKGDQGMKSDFATRICGSDDLFKHNGRGPFHSINFITAHDGFTLRDLVSYNGKHNECNGENSGDDHNNSWNCGAEGDTNNEGIRHFRERQMRNFMVALLLSAGTPMLVFGDEYGRTQKGCNNGWCQDSLSWFSWNACAKEENKLMRFCRLLISVRKTYGHIFNRTSFFTDKDIWWRVHWDDPYNYICYVLHDHKAQDGYGALLVAFNAGSEHRDCDLPAGNTWYRIVDTNLAPPKDICENEGQATKVNGNYRMNPYSCIVLKTHGSPKSAVDYSKSEVQYSQAQDIHEHLRKVVQRRMSQNFISNAPDPEEEVAHSMLRRRSQMSGTIMIVDDGEQGQRFVVVRPGDSEPEAEAPPLPEAAMTSSSTSFAPPPRSPKVVEKAPPRPPLGSRREEIMTAALGGARWVQVQVHQDEEGSGTTKTVEVAVKGFGTDPLLLHWGAIETWGGRWSNPPADVLDATVPPSSALPGANRTTFPAGEDDGCRRVFLPFCNSYMPKSLHFVLHVPPNEWLKHNGGDFKVDMPGSQQEYVAARKRAEEALPEKSTKKHAKWSVHGFNLELFCGVGRQGCTFHFLANVDGPLMLHYGPGDPKNKWISAKSVDFVASKEDGMKEVCVNIAPEEATDRLMFVLKLGGNHWVKDGANDFVFHLPEDATLAEALQEVKVKVELKRQETQRLIDEEASKYQKNLEDFRKGRKEREKGAVAFTSFELTEGAGDVDVVCSSLDGLYQVELKACLNHKVAPPAASLLHWGTIADLRRKEWQCPPEDLLPQGTKLVGAKACQSPLFDFGHGVYGLRFEMPGRPSERNGAKPGETEPSIAGMAFVLHVPEGNRWLKSTDGKDCFAVFRADVRAGAWKGEAAPVANQIVEAERDWSHMTLMHRYNLCNDMIGKWLSSAGACSLRRAPSWSSLFKPKRMVSFSRMPSSSFLEAAESAGAEGRDDEFWSWIFVWQRMSFIKVLDWQRNYNTKPRELAAATDGLARRLCDVWKDRPNVRLWCRWTLATLGRGGNRGQEIRDEILHIMHRNKIPETAGHFYEQWHQKLHNNTTPDDIGICKALLAYLRSGGKMDTYWSVLRDNGITRERLASYDRAITKEPYMHGDAGRLIFEFENYLKILQSVHDALDLQTSIEACKGSLPPHVVQKLHDICNTGGMTRTGSRYLEDVETDTGRLDSSHQRFMRVAEARETLLAMLNDGRTSAEVIRQLLLLDYSLETQQTVLIQGASSETRLPVLCDQMQALLTAVLGHMPLLSDLRALLLDWANLARDCSSLRYNNDAVESALLLKAMCDRLARVVGDQVDKFQTLMGVKANHLGLAVGAPKQVLDVFVDEVLRGSALFSVSLVLKRLEPQLRSIAQLPPWQMISAVDHPVCGELQVVDKMLHMQDKIFETPTVLLSGMVSGEEEVPVGVQAVLVRDAASAPDILSHCAVRARNSGVLLATCFDPSITQKIEQEFVGEWVELRCKSDGTVSVEIAPRPGGDPQMMRRLSRTQLRDDAQDQMQSKPGETKLVNMNLNDDLGCRWCITPSDMNRVNVGSKSLNLAKLAPLLPKDVRTPQAVAMPYGCMQKVLTHKENAKVLPKLEACLRRLQPTTSNDDARCIFEEAQHLVESLEMPPELAKALGEAMEQVGSEEGEKRLSKLYREPEAWSATRKVWASLFGLRPWVSLAKAGRSFHDLNMAVLVQELLPAKYAFVLHTKNPFTNDADEVYGEIVPGRGETLVGNFPGRALSFRAKKGCEPVVSAFLSKSTWLRTQECLIFRSDSNGEDLEGFAGAGLFESICATSDIPCMVQFHRLSIIADSAYRKQLLSRLAEVGRAVERAFGGMPQDIEGCVDPQDRIFIVQSRPQV